MFTDILQFWDKFIHVRFSLGLGLIYLIRDALEHHFRRGLLRKQLVASPEHDQELSCAQRGKVMVDCEHL